MIGLADVRDWLASLDAVEATWTIGRYEAGRQHACCVYQRQAGSGAQVALGRATLTLVKSVSVLVRWDQSHRRTEEAAMALYSALEGNPDATIGGHDVSYVDLVNPEPVDLGSDADGIFERAIWLDIYYQAAEAAQNGGHEAAEGNDNG